MNKPKVLQLAPDHKEQLDKLANSGMTPVVIAQRAKILLYKSQGLSNEVVAEKLGINKRTVLLWTNKYVNRNDDDTLETLLNVAKGRGCKNEIAGEAKTWLISVACTKPKDLGYAAETWTTSLLTKHIHKTAAEAGFDRLTTISESGVYQILDKSNIKPFRIQYYCERRDPDFEDKMHNVLLVYKQLSLQFDEDGNLLPFDDGPVTHVLSYDEKPGIQAIATTGEDLNPTEEHGTIKRDYEYKRLGTVSLLAGIDLQTGEAIPLVSSTHNSEDYIEFLKKLDAKYPQGDKIRLVLDNLKVHSSVAVQEYLATVPDRFEFVFTPKHASWLNLVEGFFSKMTKQMLRGIRVKTKDELVTRIYKYFDEINETPVVYHWTWNLDDIDPSETVVTETFSKSVAN
ncbi:MAG: IS630 family transposase [Lachnospiraceae bacterium]|nr:IS630 family transposase [Lachnospiraceae bacterium]